MATIINLNEVRAKKWNQRGPVNPLAEFGCAWDRLMDAVDRIDEAPPCAALVAARTTILDACERLLAREKRFYGE
ncbi:hypothetical protein X739_01325 [Mesorhizobium sp. LNHC220B00]|nr:hypothetical protein [Mesorhizobium sp. LNHC220B00]ESY89078.1 hypothetical protein X739_01325 [Mesorhizobium sp. LNHC220B00]